MLVLPLPDAVRFPVDLNPALLVEYAPQMKRRFKLPRTTLSANDFQRKAHSFCIGDSYGDNDTYPELGLTEESGEVAGKIAKFIRKHNGIEPDRWMRGRGVAPTSQNGRRITRAMARKLREDYGTLREDVLAEIGDVLWMCAEICTIFGLKLEDAMKYNVAKLTDRRKRGVIIGNGDHR